MLISVIIPVFNHVRYVETAIKSVINQDYKNIELIVLNDGSTDGSHEIIEKLKKEFNFRYIKKQNEGISKTLQLGLSMCSGEYIAILASDDQWLPNKISRQVAHMKSFPDCCACCALVNVIDEYDNITPNPQTADVERYDFSRVMTEGHKIPPATIFIRKSSLSSCYFDPTLKVEDLYLWLCLTEHEGYIDVLPQVLANYRIHSSNTTGNLALIAKYHHIILDRFESTSVYEKAKIKWSLFSFRQLARKYKVESLKYIYPSWKFFISKSFVIGMIKLIFAWK